MRPDEAAQLFALYRSGRFRDAEACARRLLTRPPQSAACWKILASALIRQGKDALPELQKVVELLPEDVVFRCALANALLARGQLAAAVECYREAVRLEPAFADAHNNLANALRGMGRIEEAIESYRRALQINPELAEAHSNLGNALRERGHLVAAISSYRRALQADPRSSAAHNNLGNGLKDLGLLEDAVESYQRALQFNPLSAHMHSNLLLTRSLLADSAPAQMLAEARRYGDMVTQCARPQTTWRNSPEPERCLRVGLVSGDLRAHPVGFFVEGFLSALAAAAAGRVEFFGYFNYRNRDMVTRRIMASCRGWHDVVDLPDDALAARIRADRIDILLDLSGHTARSRLPVFAWRPAPVQASWLGIATTGVAAIDWFVADHWTLPPSEEAHFTEKVWRLPETHLCFTPATSELPVAPLPALQTGYVTFGSFNNLSKMNEAVVDLWARVLASVAGSRLFLKSRQLRDAEVCRDVAARFAARGIGAERLLLSGTVLVHQHHLATYDRVDIALDPFPYCGVTTSVEGLWMGVPVLTLAGERFISRQGVSLLMNGGLPEWIATDPDDYVARAVRHAADLPKLAELRAGLRQKILASPILDAPRFARHFEAALRGMWRDWCERPGRRTPPVLEARLQVPPTWNKPNKPAPGERTSIAPAHDERRRLLRLLDQGRLADLEIEARTLSEGFPRSALVWKLLGASLQLQGKDGLPALRKAVTFSPQDAESHNNLGNALFAAGRIDAAAASFRQALALRADYAQAHGNLANALNRLGRSAEALTHYARSAELDAENGAAQLDLARQLYRLGRRKDAIASFRRALQLDPRLIEAHINLGNALRDSGDPAAAATCHRRALELDPSAAQAHNNLGNALRDLGDMQAAIASYRRALEIDPGFVAAHSNLGTALSDLGDLDAAAESYRRALELDPRYAQAHSNLGIVLKNLGRMDEAIASYRRALQIDPHSVAAHSNLGNALRDSGNLVAAAASHRRALQIDPRSAEAHANLAVVLKDLGRLDDAVASFRQALAIAPDSTQIRSALLFTQVLLASVSPAQALADALDYGKTVASRARAQTQFPNRPDIDRCLRIGVLSADLRSHSIGYFVEGVLAALARAAADRVQFFGYYSFPGGDAVTERIKASCRGWHDVAGLSDRELADLIRVDRIDVLLDLSGHTAQNRLSAFAWKPAPVQATWLGIATTGIAEIDWFIADPWTLPPSEEANFSERIWRLPETYVCFTPPDDILPVGTLPAPTAGHVTFGSFNNLSKMDEPVVALWARVLERVPGSRLYLKARQLKDADVRRSVAERFAAQGIGPERLTLEGFQPGRAQHLDCYNRVDIALDPFPYSGVTTSVESLWMGVPVLTLAGERFISRQGVSLLMNAGLPEWIATDPDDFVARAASHAGDLPRLARLRSGLRQQVLAAPIFDAPRFARHFEAALRGMWRDWCTRQKTANVRPSPKLQARLQVPPTWD